MPFELIPVMKLFKKCLILICVSFSDNYCSFICKIIGMKIVQFLYLYSLCYSLIDVAHLKINQNQQQPYF